MEQVFNRCWHLEYLIFCIYSLPFNVFLIFCPGPWLCKSAWSSQYSFSKIKPTRYFKEIIRLFLGYCYQWACWMVLHRKHLASVMVCTMGECVFSSYLNQQGTCPTRRSKVKSSPECGRTMHRGTGMKSSEASGCLEACQGPSGNGP